VFLELKSIPQNRSWPK